MRSAIWSEGGDARNLITNQNDSVLALGQVHGSTKTPFQSANQLARREVKNLHPVVSRGSHTKKFLLSINDHRMGAS